LALSNDLWSCFALPLLVEAFQGFQELNVIISDTHLVARAVDKREFVWGRKYFSSRFYRFMFEHLPKYAALNAIWKSKTLPKLNVFSWLIMVDRINTKDIMLRKHWQINSGSACILFQGNVLKNRDHLFLIVSLRLIVGEG
jgi:hypothetical protein